MPKYTFIATNVTCEGCFYNVQEPLETAFKSYLVNEDSIGISLEEHDRKIKGRVHFHLKEDCPLTDKQIEIEISKEIAYCDFKKIEENNSSFQDEIKSPCSQAEIHTPLLEKKPANTKPAKKKSHYWTKALLGILAGGAYLTFLALGLHIPLIADYALDAIMTSLTLYLGKETFLKAGSDLIKEQRLGMEALLAGSTLSMLSISIASIFCPSLPCMLEAGLLTFGFKNLGEGIKSTLRSNNEANLSLCDQIKETIQDKDNQSINTRELKPDDIINLQTNDIVPVDCLCEEAVIVNNSANTGTNAPYRVEAGAVLLQGMKIIQIAKPLKVIRPFNESNFALRDRMILQAEQESAPILTKTNRILGKFVPFSFLLAILAGVGVGILTASPVLGIKTFATVLGALCPCTLGSIIPHDLKIGLAKAGENGVTFNSRRALQNLTSVQDVVFDLNGTLTEGEPRVTNFLLAEDENKEEILQILFSLEQDTDNLAGKAIYNYCANKKSCTEVKSDALQKKTRLAFGLSGIWDQQEYCVGSQNQMDSLGIETRQFMQSCNFKKDDLQNIIFIARNKIIIGIITVQDSIRSEAKAIIKELKSSGKTIHLCTGAPQDIAEKYAKELGIDSKNVQGGSHPSNIGNVKSKTQFIENIKKQKRIVAMVGDGINDVDAMVKADIGIALKSASSNEVTCQKAKVLIKGSLLPLATAFAASKQTLKVIKQNLTISFITNLLTMAAIATLLITISFANPVLGVALMILQSSIVLANSQRFKKQKLQYSPEIAIEMSKCKSVAKQADAFPEITLQKKSAQQQPDLTLPKVHRSPIATTHSINNRIDTVNINEAALEPVLRGQVLSM